VTAWGEKKKKTRKKSEVITMIFIRVSGEEKRGHRSGQGSGRLRMVKR